MSFRKENLILKKRISLVLVFLIIVAFSISGYKHQQDINDAAYVIAIGIDERYRE